MNENPETGPRPDASRITDDICIGNCFAGRHRETLACLGIRAVVSLDGTHRGVSAHDLGVDILRGYSLIDGEGNGVDLFRRAVDAVARCRRDAGTVLVHCHAGRSRSVIVVAAHLVAEGGFSGVDAALEFISTRREIAVAPALKSLARATYG